MAVRARRKIADSDRRMEIGGVHQIVTLKTSVFLQSDGVAERAI
jgi:hypothetical protein